MWIRMTIAVLAWTAATQGASPAPARSESVGVAMCRLIEAAAAGNGLPNGFLTRLIWRESSFRPGVVSPAGAQGIAQFMPGTAAERGLVDSFDPQQAIPAAARLLADLRQRFGNLGLAAAAYNAGPTRVANWLAGRGGLPGETRRYVAAVTDRSVDEWSSATDQAETTASASAGPTDRCLSVVAALRTGPATADVPATVQGPWAPWGVQIAGNFSKPLSLALYQQVAQRHHDLFADLVPMIIGTRLRFRGGGTFWRVRVPAASRGDAETWCGRLRRAGGNCAVLKS
jgi:hypothetical protein